MVDGIQVPKVKGLESYPLTKLGKINVICGKNNSGKSTVLQGILAAKEKREYFGKKFSREEFYAILEDAKKQIGDVHGGIHPELEKALFEMVVDKTWILYQQNQFGEKFFKDAFPDLVADIPKVNAFSSLMFGIIREPNSIALIPIVRELESIIQSHELQNVQTEGKGILGQLYSLKNQLEETLSKETYVKFQKAFQQVSSGFSFDIELTDNNKNIRWRFTHEKKNWWTIEECGKGLQDLIVILYYAMIAPHEIILIEEPENHMHPEMQRNLIRLLRETPDKQFFFTTHSNIFLNSTLVDRVFFTNYDKETQKILISDVTSKAQILDSIGFSVTDNLVADLIILTEGPKDRLALTEFLIKFGLISQYDIKMWPLGGDIMGEIDLSVLAEKSLIIGLVDNDPKSKSARNKFLQKCKNHDIHCHRLSRYALENYYTLDALKQVFGPQGKLNSITKIEHEINLEKQIGINVKKNGHKIVKNMSIGDIEGTDLFDFFKEVKEMCKDKIPYRQ